MAVTLEIQDGSPWYLSTDVWTVPGDDPLGPPGMPLVGSPCYLWARVHNNGSNAVTNATVRFYWANPNVGFDRTTANLIGSAFVSLGASPDVQEVLCLTPWVPVFVNGGHECVLAEAFHSVDPLPPGPAFNVPTDRHVAQRNLQVVLAAQRQFHFAFEVHNPSRQKRTFSISAERGKLRQIRNFGPLLGRQFQIPEQDGEIHNVGFVAKACPDGQEQPVPSIKKLILPPFGRTGFSLVGQLEGDGAVIHVQQKVDDQIVGGLAVLVVKGGEN